MSVQSSRKIGARIVILIAAVLTATSVLFLALFAPLYRQEVAQERKATSLRLAGMLQIALENAMLKRDIPGLRQIVDGLGRSPDVDLVMIIAPSGEVRFSSDSTQIGRRTELEALCAGCDGLINTTRPGAEAAGFVRNARGAFVLRSVRAVANREACSQCHGPPDSHPVNGFLVVRTGVPSFIVTLGTFYIYLSLGNVYGEGNFIEATPDTCYFQIGETKYGKPIIDRVLKRSTSLLEATKCTVVSFDSTMRSNISVGLPIDLCAIETDALRLRMQRRIDESDPYFRMVHEQWGEGLKRVFADLPDPNWA